VNGETARNLESLNSKDRRHVFFRFGDREPKSFRRITFLLDKLTFPSYSSPSILAPLPPPNPFPLGELPAASRTESCDKKSLLNGSFFFVAALAIQSPDRGSGFEVTLKTQETCGHTAHSVADAGWSGCYFLQTQHQLLKVKMYIGFRISAMHFDAVPPVRSVAIVDLAEVLNFESPIAVRDGATDDRGVRHAGMLSRHYDTDVVWCGAAPNGSHERRKRKTWMHYCLSVYSLYPSWLL
jgi:hypothetical protein